MGLDARSHSAAVAAGAVNPVTATAQRYAARCKANSTQHRLPIARRSADPGHHSILTTNRYTHLTSQTEALVTQRIDALMGRFNLGWGAVK